MSRSVKLEDEANGSTNGIDPALQMIKEFTPEIQKETKSGSGAPLIGSVAMTKQNGNTEKKFIQFLQIIERNKQRNPNDQPLALRDFVIGI